MKERQKTTKEKSIRDPKKKVMTKEKNSNILKKRVKNNVGKIDHPEVKIIQERINMREGKEEDSKENKDTHLLDKGVKTQMLTNLKNRYLFWEK